MLPHPEVAYQVIFDHVHAPVFFEKLAAYGYYPQHAGEAQELLYLAGQLRSAQEQEMVKAAAFSGSLPYDEPDAMMKQAAYTLAHEPAIYNSVLSLKALEAASVQAGLLS